MQAAWEKLHTGCWKDVEPAWRDAYALACLLRALVRLSRLHVSPPAVSKPPCSAAASDSLLRVSQSQSKHLQQTGEQVDTHGRTASTEGQHAELESLAAEPLRGRQQPSSTLHCGKVLREDPSKPVRTGGRPEEHTETQDGNTGSPAGRAIEAAMRELDLGIMMGGHTYQDSLHAAVAIAQKAWIECSAAGSAVPIQQDPVRREDSACEQGKHKQPESDKKRKRPTSENSIGECASSGPTNGTDCNTVPKVGQSSKAAAWAPAELSHERLCKLQQQLPPGAPHTTPCLMASCAGTPVGFPCPQTHTMVYSVGFLSVLEVSWVLNLQDP